MRGIASLASLKVSRHPLYLSHKLTSLPPEHQPLSNEWHTTTKPLKTTPPPAFDVDQCHLVLGGWRRSLAVLGAHSIAGIAVTSGKHIRLYSLRIL